MITGDTPKFDSPPVVEALIGVQFAELPGFATAHVGRFWREFLTGEWNEIQDQHRLEDEFESFADEDRFPPNKLRLRSEAGANRTWIIHRNDDWMIQVQDTRFIVNWRQREQDYPSYGRLRPQFDGRFAEFMQFCTAQGYGDPMPNQWEVTYVNHLPKGKLWEQPSEIRNIFPWLAVPDDLGDRVLERVNQRFAMRITDGENNLGRLHVVIAHGQADGKDVIVFRQTARGPVDETMSLESGVDLGHNIIVRTFADLTSDAAQTAWGRTR